MHPIRRLSFLKMPLQVSRLVKVQGAMIVGICSTYDPEKVWESGADIVVKDLSSFEIDHYNPETDEFREWLLTNIIMPTSNILFVVSHLLA